MTDLELRAVIYEHFATTGRAPSVDVLTSIAGGPELTIAALRRLHDGHMVVLGADGEIAMALPFSATPTEHVVTADDRTWWANCAWDAFAIVAATQVDAHISSRWIDTGAPVDISIDIDADGDDAVSASDGFVHFAIPARRWWDDIVET